METSNFVPDYKSTQKLHVCLKHFFNSVILSIFIYNGKSENTEDLSQKFTNSIDWKITPTVVHILKIILVAGDNSQCEIFNFVLTPRGGVRDRV